MAEGVIVLGCRDTADAQDLFVAQDADTGAPLWQVAYDAPGALDYGNSPRTTPLIHDGLVFLLGAMGHLTCADLATGAILWQRQLVEEFGAPPLEWGLTGSPLLDDGRLIVQPGGSRGSLAALDPFTGETLWATGTAPPGHASPITVEVKGRRQIILYDKLTLGGWDAATGARLWSIVPPLAGDFNVPTPLWLGDRLLATTENNGTRLYRPLPDGGLDPTPAAVNEDLAPDSHSPVVAGRRVFGVSAGLWCLDLQDSLKTLWRANRPEFREYASLVATDARLLCLTLDAQVLLIDATADEYRELGRWKLGEPGDETYSHPALADERLYVRIGRKLLCLDLAASAP